MIVRILAAVLFDHRTAKKSGKPYAKQRAALIRPGNFDLPFTLTRFCEGNASEPTPLAAGDYTLDPESYRVSQYGDLEVSPRLIPVAKAKAS